MNGGLFATRDAALINSFINDPDVLPYCGFPAGTVSADVSDRIGDPEMLFVTDGHSAMMGFQRSDTAWEKHNLFRRACRGRAAIAMARAIFAWVRNETDATIIIARTPITNRACRWFNRQIGMVSRGVQSSARFGAVEFFEKDLSCL